MKSGIMSFDGQTGAPDSTMVDEALSLIRSLAKEGLARLIVIREMNFTREVFSRIFYINHGVNCESGKPADVFDDPERDKTRCFINGITG